MRDIAALKRLAKKAGLKWSIDTFFACAEDFDELFFELNGLIDEIREYKREKNKQAQLHYN